MLDPVQNRRGRPPKGDRKQTIRPFPYTANPCPYNLRKKANRAYGLGIAPAQCEPLPTDTVPAQGETLPTDTVPAQCEPLPTDTVPAQCEPLPTDTVPAQCEPLPTDIASPQGETLPADDITPTESELAEGGFSLQDDRVFFGQIPYTGLMYAWECNGRVSVKSDTPRGKDVESLFAYKDGVRIRKFCIEYSSHPGHLKIIKVIDQGNDGTTLLYYRSTHSLIWFLSPFIHR